MKRYTLLLTFILLRIFEAYAQTVCPPNIDFEQGNFTNWTPYTGTCCPINVSQVGAPVSNRHELKSIVSTPSTDPYGGFPVIAPSSGLYSVKIGNDQTGAQAESIRYFLKIPSTASSAYVLVFRYAVVFQDPGHTIQQQPRFEVAALDSATGDTIGCNHFTFVASSSLPGFITASTGSNVLYKPWSTYSIDLSKAKGKTVALDFATGDCALGAHFGYGYVDVNCGLFETLKKVCSPGDLTQVVAPAGFQNYAWWDSAFTTYYGGTQTQNLTVPYQTKTYAVVLTPYPGLGCNDTLYTTLSLEDLVTNPTSDTTICVDSSIALQLHSNVTAAYPPVMYSWAPPTGLSCTNCADPVANLSANAKYYFTVVDSKGCKRWDTLDINVGKTVIANMSKPADSVCQFLDVGLQNLFKHKIGSAYDWGLDSGGKIRSIDTNTAVVYWTTTGLKKIKLHVHNGGCYDDDSAYVYVKPTSVASFDLKKTACINEELTLTPMETKDATYHWTITQGSITDTTYVPKYTLKWDNKGLKTVTLTLNAKNFCATAPYSSTVFVNDNPDAKISLSTDNYCIGDHITLRCNEGSDNYYAWSPVEYFETNNYHEVTMKVENSTVVNLKVINRWGCYNTDSTYINTTTCCRPIMPGAFTPNKDGHNDTYRPLGLDNQQVISFVVRNRYGQVVFEGKNSKDTWDGTINGTPQDVGTYYYYLKYLCNYKDTKEEKGSFTLLR
ncbi:MAG: gliding motility-associated C-terminal domain-containing protein [Bacteroidetes bacterium]|nr:gliding motility-associated C-terminal domain-containing protein [Bacteroidota bacterium]